MIPVTGARKSIKVFGAVDVFTARFHHGWDAVFNEGYLKVRDCVKGQLLSGCTVLKEVGAPANCKPGLQTEELPPTPDDAATATTDPDASEQPAVPPDMPEG